MNRLKKAMSILLSLILVISMFTFGPVVASADDTGLVPNIESADDVESADSLDTTDKNMKKDLKKVTVKGQKSVSKVIKNLKKGKTYYFRIRTYQTVGEKKYYSAWSAVKSVKIEK